MTSLAPVDRNSPSRRLRILRRPSEPIRAASPRPQRRDCQGQLIAAIEAMTGGDGTIDEASLRPWCSATFIGAQHRLRLRIRGADAVRRAQMLGAGLGDAAFALRGHVVVDATVDASWTDESGDALLALAILTIEDW